MSQKGHFACRSGGVAGLHEVTEHLDDINTEKYAFLGEIGTEASEPWIETVQVNGENMVFKLDTGADVTSIPDKFYKPERDGELQKPKKRLLGPSRYTLKVPGCFTTKMSAKGRSSSQDVYLVSGLAQPLLGRPAVVDMGLVHRVGVIRTEPDFRAAYSDVFRELGKLKEPYRAPLPLREAVQAELKRMEDMGVISKVTEPTAWCSGIVVIPKPGKKPPRICVDLTPLNAVVKRERHTENAYNILKTGCTIW